MSKINTEGVSLFGEIDKNKEIPVNMDILNMSFEQESSVIYGFCNNCSTYHEIAEEQTKTLFSIAGESYENLEQKYIVLGSCPLCNGEDNHFSINLKSI